MDPVEAALLLFTLFEPSTKDSPDPKPTATRRLKPSSSVSPPRSPSRLCSPPPKCKPQHAVKRPNRPVLKLPLPPNPFLPPGLPLRADDLSALVAECLSGNTTPKRQSSSFRFCDLPANPTAPPPTPVAWDVMGTPSEKGDGLSPGEWMERIQRSSSSSGSRASSATPRGSGELKRVSFKEEWQDDEGLVGSGRVSEEYKRGRPTPGELKMTELKRV